MTEVQVWALSWESDRGGPLTSLGFGVPTCRKATWPTHCWEGPGRGWARYGRTVRAPNRLRVLCHPGVSCLDGQTRGGPHTEVWGQDGDVFAGATAQVAEGTLPSPQEPQRLRGNSLWQAGVTTTPASFSSVSVPGNHVSSPPTRDHPHHKPRGRGICYNAGMSAPPQTCAATSPGSTAQESAFSSPILSDDGGRCH